MELKKYKLGDIADIIGGVSYQPSDICNNGIRIIRGGNIQSQNIVLKEDDVFLPDEYGNEDNQIHIEDTILVASTGSVEMDADHVTAWSKGGVTGAENCEMLCKTHNRAKGNR